MKTDKKTIALLIQRFWDSGYTCSPKAVRNESSSCPPATENSLQELTAGGWCFRQLKSCRSGSAPWNQTSCVMQCELLGLKTVRQPVLCVTITVILPSFSVHTCLRVHCPVNCKHWAVLRGQCLERFPPVAWRNKCLIWETLAGGRERGWVWTGFWTSFLSPLPTSFFSSDSQGNHKANSGLNETWFCECSAFLLGHSLPTSLNPLHLYQPHKPSKLPQV